MEPNYPGALSIVVTATAVQAVSQKEKHNEAIRVFKECRNVEKALVRQIQTAVDEKFTDYLVDNDTGLIEDNISTVLEYLFANYGKVTSEEVKQKESKVLSITINPSDPMVTLYCPIEKI